MFDTLSLSLCQGYQAVAAARAAAAGLSVDEVIALLESIRARTHLYGCLDTVEYARRGGRVDALIPVLERVARVLSIKPILHVVDGELKLLGAARSLAKGVRRIRQEVARRGPVEALFVIHTRQADAAKRVAQALAKQEGLAFEDVLIAEAGPALASHGGPGVLAAGMVERAD